MRSCWWLVLLAMACGEPWKNVVHPSTGLVRPTSKPTLGRIEGRVIDSKTGAGVVGIEVALFGACQRGSDLDWTLTDQNGRFELEMPEGDCVIVGHYGDASTRERRVRIAAQQTTVVDLTIDHRALTAALVTRPPLSCPSSKRNEVVEGHQPSPSDLEDIVRAVLDRGDIPDARNAVVRAEIGSGRTVSSHALPEGYVLRTQAELEAKAKRTNTRVWYLGFSSVYATETCGVVSVGGDLVHSDPGVKLCCCAATDLYEKRDGRWHFARRVITTCG